MRQVRCLKRIVSVIAVVLISATPASAQDAPRPDPADLIGTWEVDLRPTPDAEPYLQEFVVTTADESGFTGSFYGTAIEEGRLNLDWRAVRFAFVTADGSGPYHHSGVLRDGRMEGMTHSLGRDFLSYWTANRVMAQETGSFEALLLGRWVGELDYLDYSDNETLVKLPTRLVADFAEDGKGLDLSYFFEEPDGSIVEGRDRFYETADGVFFGDSWAVLEREVDLSRQSLRVVLARDGMDDDQPARIETTLERRGSRLTITKNVQYVGSSAPIRRNQFRFERESP
ncbi:MAG: hypothetical protein M8858_04005 [marine benthic group bacterium]|nr:hypothetical protein [Gemmatimonadota bacterium]